MTTNGPETAPLNWDVRLRLTASARAAEFLRDFGQNYATPAVTKASELHGAYRSGELTPELAKEHSVATPEEFDQVWGIVTDFPVVYDYLLQNAWMPKPGQDKWATEAHINDTDNLLGLGENINLETILIQSVQDLSVMDVYDGKSETVYDAIVRSESVFAPLCEIIGIDGLAMALRSKAECIRLRNSGKEHFVSESERIALAYQNKQGEFGEIFHHHATGILRAIIGGYTLEPILGTDSKHGIVIEEGYSDEKSLRIIARLKSVGARAGKLVRSAAANNGIMEPNIDDIGITLISQDDEHLAKSYVEAAQAMLASEQITPWPSPSRDEAFHIGGSQALIDTMRDSLTLAFPDSIQLFQFAPNDSGFHVAKMTGYYESDMGCAPFEVQLLTQEGRKDSRIGRAAHIFYKIMRKLGHRYTPGQSEIDRLAALNARKARLGTDGLCPSSQERLTAFVQELNA